MTDFDTRFSARGFPKLLERFGESVVYKPKSGPARTITAVVDRNPPVQGEEHPLTNADLFIIEVYDDETDGIGIRELNTGADAVDIAKRKRGPVSTMRLYKLISQDGGVLRIEVR